MLRSRQDAERLCLINMVQRLTVKAATLTFEQTLQTLIREAVREVLRDKLPRLLEERGADTANILTH